jgi:CheY-like chemotaxis protein
VPKLLLADDSPTTQKVVQLTFADEGIDVVVADDGDLALELYEHHHPDIVLADINIPGLNGYEVCEAIRKRSDNGSTPVILLAGSFEPFDVEEAHRVGANDYLTKPFSSIRRLVATVTALLDTVVRHDEAVEETFEPNSVPPDVEENDAEQVHRSAPPENQPGPSLPPEPDPYATDDIENLIQQSFVETVEMPHTVAERMMNEIAAARSEENIDVPAAARDEAAFDDELIETTYTSGSSEDREPAREEPPVTLSGEDSSIAMFAGETAPEAELTTDEQPIEEGAISKEFRDEAQRSENEIILPPLTSETYGESVSTAELSQAPTEEFQIDQSGDETYFEPTTDTAEQSIEEQHQPSDEQTGFQILNIAEPTATFPRPMNFHREEVPVEPVAESPPEQELEPQPENVDEQQPSPTPWDSVAEPRPARFQLDESNLLELPLDRSHRRDSIAAERSAEISDTMAKLEPALVDEIARATASQISEELVREIAQRIVPKVVEEVIARHRGETDEH